MLIDKRQNGQFFTKNSDYILSNFSRYVRNKKIVDPFAGSGDLIKWAEKHYAGGAMGFDIDPKYINNKNIFLNDSIQKPQKYDFVLTNPPYLHKNKANKDIKDEYFDRKNSIFEDLYQVSINSILNCDEGIIIVPLNFLCAENSQRIRSLFFEKFEIVKLNIFSEQVFEDTTYNVISFYFKKKKNVSQTNIIPATIFPDKKEILILLEKRFNWQFGGEFVNRIKQTKNYLGISRLTEDYLKFGEYDVELAFQNIKDKIFRPISAETKKMLNKNILLLRAIDSKNGKKIMLEDIRSYGVRALVGKDTSRNMAHLIFHKEIPIEDQIELMNRFNEELNQERDKYLSFFLTNFRDNNRKRISFDLVYKFLNYIYNKQNEKQSSLL